MRYSAVLWDMDGTLVDTEPYWIRAEQALMSRHGLPWSDEQGMLMVGNALPRSAQILQEHGLRMEAHEIVDELLGSVIDQVRAHIPWRPGARELLDALRCRDIPCALVTMSYRPLAEAVVAGLPTGTFRGLITGDEVARGKPAPDPYAAGAELLGMAAGECLALEDSAPGLASATAAGVLAVGIPHVIPLDEGPGYVLIDSLAGVSPEDLDALAVRLSA